MLSTVRPCLVSALALASCGMAYAQRAQGPQTTDACADAAPAQDKTSAGTAPSNNSTASAGANPASPKPSTNPTGVNEAPSADGTRKGPTDSNSQDYLKNTASSGLGLGTGDVITLGVSVRGFYELEASKQGAANHNESYAPPGTDVQIDNTNKSRECFFVHVLSVPKSDTAGGKGNQSTTGPQSTTEQSCRQGERPAPRSLLLRVYSTLRSFSGISHKWPTGEDWGLCKVNTGVEYRVAADAFDRHGVQSSGVDYGLLVVPYKYHPQDHTFAAGGTVGAYVGVHNALVPGTTGALVFSAGLGNVSVTSPGATPGSSPKTDNKASLSIATGWVFTLSKNGQFQFGILLGRDYAGTESGYRYEGRNWFALAFGTTLTK